VQDIIDGVIINARCRLNKEFVSAYYGRNPYIIFEQFKQHIKIIKPLNQLEVTFDE